jgi:arylsulfatase A-like enzyme
MDVTATVLHLTSGHEQTSMGAEALHGRSLLPLARGAATWDRPVHYAEYHGDWYGHYSSRMVTDGQWKLVLNLSDLCELYDLQEDPHELRNLFYEPARRVVRGRYFDLLRSEAARLGDGQVGYYTAAIEEETGRMVHGPLVLPAG